MRTVQKRFTLVNTQTTHRNSTPDNLSKLNTRTIRRTQPQTGQLAKYLEPMTKEFSISPADVAILTPYRANTRALQKRLRTAKVLEDIICTTIDTFQGREAQIIIVAFCVTKSKEAPFAADPRRLNVALMH